MNTQLLCTFSNKKDVDDTLEEIQEHYDIIFDKIFILQNKDDSDELFFTYNIDKDSGQQRGMRMDKTISVHRKKHTNTIYTINALNSLIIMLNGSIDETYPVPWEEYKNQILLTVNGTLKQTHTNLYDIVYI